MRHSYNWENVKTAALLMKAMRLAMIVDMRSVWIVSKFTHRSQASGSIDSVCSLILIECYATSVILDLLIDIVVNVSLGLECVLSASPRFTAV